MPGGKRQKTYKISSPNGNITDVLKELWQAAASKWKENQTEELP
jgi:hypothetical protein